MNPIRRVLMAVSLLALSAGAAHAAFWNQDEKTCASRDAPDLAVVACTSRIKNVFVPRGAKSAAYNNRALAHVKKGEFDLAMADLNNAIALNAASSEAFYNRGVVFNDGLGMPARAIQDFNQAIALRAAAVVKPPAVAKKDFPQALNYRGLAYEGLGQYDQAVKDFSEVLRLNPKFSPALANRGLAYAKLRRYPAALTDLNGALKADSTVPSRWAARCWIRLKLAARPGLPDVDALNVAQWDCGHALALDPANIDARNGQGVIKLMVNDPAGAMAEFQAVLVVDNKNTVALFGRGYAKRAIGDTAGGDADMGAARGAAPLVTVDFWDARIIPSP